MHVIIWAYQVRSGREIEFEKVHGPNGDWAALFQQAEGFLGVELLRDANVSLRYVTIDRWASSAAYELFREKWIDAYEALDARCAELTERESRLGIFTSQS
jgi:heme-degrading monooxygenase HmoA